MSSSHSPEKIVLTKSQLRFITSPSRKKVFIGGHGAGKTFAMILAIMAEACSQPQGCKAVYAIYTPMPHDAAEKAVRIAYSEDFQCKCSYTNVYAGGVSLSLENGAQIRFHDRPRAEFVAMPPVGVVFDEVDDFPWAAVREVLTRIKIEHKDSLILFSAVPSVWEEDAEVFYAGGDGECHQ